MYGIIQINAFFQVKPPAVFIYYKVSVFIILVIQV